MLGEWARRIHPVAVPPERERLFAAARATSNGAGGGRGVAGRHDHRCARLAPRWRRDVWVPDAGPARFAGTSARRSRSRSGAGTGAGCAPGGQRRCDAREAGSGPGVREHRTARRTAPTLSLGGRSHRPGDTARRVASERRGPARSRGRRAGPGMGCDFRTHGCPRLAGLAAPPGRGCRRRARRAPA